MSYQLLPAYYTTSNTRKKKKPKIDRDKMVIEMKKHNKDMRRIRAFSCQFDTVEEMSSFASRNGFYLIDPIEIPLEPYIPEIDDPILRGEVSP